MVTLALFIKLPKILSTTERLRAQCLMILRHVWFDNFKNFRTFWQISLCSSSWWLWKKTLPTSWTQMGRHWRKYVSFALSPLAEMLSTAIQFSQTGYINKKDSFGYGDFVFKLGFSVQEIPLVWSQLFVYKTPFDLWLRNRSWHRKTMIAKT